jgi:hypothetical protein
MARKGIQPLWIDIRNNSTSAFRLEPRSIDPAYYTPLEAAYINHFAMVYRFLGLGLVAWVFLPALPLLPFKLYAARRANRRMNAFFVEHGYAGGPIPPDGRRSGFVFATLHEGTRNVHVELRAGDRLLEFNSAVEAPGLDLDTADEDGTVRNLVEVDEIQLRAWLEQQPRCTTNRQGTAEGDPLNLVVVGDRPEIQRCFGGRWDEAETVTLSTSLKMAKAFLLDSNYPYAPVSPLFVAGRPQQLALQRARATINERIHLRLWRTSRSFGGKQVWIGQISRDIGVRLTPRTWNLTTHKIDPNVDEARDYVLDDLMATGRASHVGYVAGVEAATSDSPRANLTGDPFFTDGMRAVAVLSSSPTRTAFLEWDTKRTAPGRD